MQIYRENDDINISKPVVTIGTFDGVHLGHRHIFKQLLLKASETGGEPVVITLWPHPRMIVHPGGTDIMILNTLEEKIELLGNQGIRHLIILPFDKGFSQLSSIEFIENYLFKRIGIKGLIIGFDHRFGKDRLGNSSQLHECARRFGFFIHDVDAFCLAGEKISSTKIRNTLFAGDVELANSMLSRNYSVSGIVEAGNKIGRDLGFPTANIRPDHHYKLVPADGVYAVKVLFEDKEFNGMLNIGHRPTVNKGNDNKSIEVHIMDYFGDLYGKRITLLFYKRMRDEMKFNSLDALKEQLKMDKINISNYFNTL
jgi:riboflavin kinase / FMN adenylyltransferase